MAVNARFRLHSRSFSVLFLLLTILQGCSSARKQRYDAIGKFSQHPSPLLAQSKVCRLRRLEALASALFSLHPASRRPEHLRHGALRNFGSPLRRPMALMQQVGDIDYDFMDECDEGMPIADTVITSPFAPEENKAESSDQEADVVTVTLQPGSLGLAYTDDTITEVVEGGQADHQGLKVGWKLVGLNGEDCQFLGDPRVLKAAQGDEPYELAFHKAEPTNFLPLTEDSVESVLDEIRPYLKNDGGNVKLRAIDGPNVIVELEGACAGCPSSAMTMKMGIENNLRAMIPEIEEVIQVAPESESLSLEAVDAVLEEVRPFITMADKNAILEVASVEGPEIQPVVKLRLSSRIGAVKSVKVEIVARIQRKFANPGLRVEWEGDDTLR